MLWQEERQFLYWLGQQSSGRPILDLGTFLGASAACIAAGAESVGSASRVFSYDLFTYGPWCAPYDMGQGWQNGDNTLPFVAEQLRPWQDRVELIKGDICQQVWTGEEVGALFVDFTQNWHHHQHVCDGFLRHLRCGGILAHQDYVHVLCYWLHIFMEYYSEHFEPISRHVESCTAAWLYVAPLPEAAFSRGLNTMLTFNQMLELLDRSIERYDDPWRGLLKIARTRFFLHARGVAAATAELTRLSDEYRDMSALQPHLENLAGELTRWPQTNDPYQDFFIDPR